MRNVLIIVISAAWFLAAPACASSSDTNERRGKITLIEPEDDPDRFVIERDNYNAALQRGPGWLMGQVRVLPVVVGRSFRGFMGNALVIAEHVDGALKKATRNVISFTKQLCERKGIAYDIVVVGKDIGAIAEEAAKFGAENVFTIDGDAWAHYLAQPYTNSLGDLAAETEADYIITSAGTFGKDCMSSDKAGEKPARRKPKVSWARLIRSGLVGS